MGFLSRTETTAATKLIRADQVKVGMTLHRFGKLDNCKKRGEKVTRVFADRNEYTGRDLICIAGEKPPWSWSWFPHELVRVSI